ncbi:MAG TPA: DUF3551 domain-containing protein [Pseudolabrys sp.]|nr:DUF3551 domain-containing protein [Pseudolabrys sp.]
MRLRHVVILTLATSALAAPSAMAQQHIEYPWCAVYGGNFGGGNCGFSTLAQCRATVSGIGGDCRPNPFYKGTPSRKSKRRSSELEVPYYSNSAGSWPSYFRD